MSQKSLYLQSHKELDREKEEFARMLFRSIQPRISKRLAGEFKSLNNQFERCLMHALGCGMFLGIEQGKCFPQKRSEANTIVQALALMFVASARLATDGRAGTPENTSSGQTSVAKKGDAERRA